MIQSTRLSPCRFAAVTLTFCFCITAVLGAPPPDPPAREFFEKKVRPLLARHCFECHGAEADEPGGNLRIDSRPSLLAGGDSGPAIVPGKPDKSLLLEAVQYSDRFEMPPDEKLAADEVAILRRWIKQGAYWPPTDKKASRRSAGFPLAKRRSEHWCWQPVDRPELPQLNQSDWPANPIDTFILAALESHGLQPNPPADRRTLIRRLTFDLTGLPPTAAEIESFLSDPDPGAVDRLIDRLLASRGFGEKWARHWLDLVRYAETLGHEFDYPIHQAWRYRDYVVRAFNDDLPYDQFIREQIAGDLLASPRRHPITEENESVLGTLSWLLGEAVHAPVDVRFDQANRIDNQIDVFGKAFLALTIACARCHDHKFDAISTRDYYAMFGVLESARRGEMFLDPHRKWERAATAIEQLQQQTTRQARQTSQHVDVRKAAKTFAERLSRALTEPSGHSAWHDPQLAEPDHPAHALRELHNILVRSTAADVAAPAFITVRRKLRQLSDRASRTERSGKYQVLFDFSSSPESAEGFTTGWAFGSGPPSRTRLETSDTFAGPLVAPGLLDSRVRGTPMVGVWRSPTFTLEHPTLFYRLAGYNVEIRLIIDGYTMNEFHTLLFKGTKFGVNSPQQWQWHRQSGDLKKYLGHTAYIEVRDLGDGWIILDRVVGTREMSPPPLLSRLATTAWDSCREDTITALVSSYRKQWQQAFESWRDGTMTHEQARLLNWSIRHDLVDLPGIRRAAQILQEKTRALVAGLSKPVLVPALVEGSPVDERVFIRGGHRNLGDVVPRGLIAALVPPGRSRVSSRLEIASVIASRDNPLTARVIVNRLWHHLFGRGLVSTVDNFGVLGQPPTHPELLDYLASDFMDHGWSLKHTIRRIVQSRTYQMASTTAKGTDQRDPANRWYHRAAVRRLPAESIRDALLAVSRRLDAAMEGPSVPAYLSPLAQGRGRPARSGPLDGAGRRTIYLEVRRNFLHPFWLAFDGPIPFSTIGRRNVSNVPAQGLAMMNDPFVRQQAVRMAHLLIRMRPEDDVDDRLEWVMIRLYGRPPNENDIAAVDRFLRSQHAAYLAAKQPADDAAIWTDVCHSLMNTKEFLFLR